jgi:glycine cleavage system H protein
VGLAASAVEELGDVTFVEPPALGRVVSAGEAVGTIEAVKAAADYYVPVGGKISEINPRLVREPQLLNTSPEDDGWMFALVEVSADDLAELLDEVAWKAWESGT